MENVKTVVTGVSFTQLLTIAFIVLKLTNVINWSWWWVLAPLWGPVALFFLVIIIVALVAVFLKHS